MKDKNWILVVGQPGGKDPFEKSISDTGLVEVSIDSRTCRLDAVLGRRVFVINGHHRESVLAFAEALVTNEPVSVKDAELFRQGLADSIPGPLVPLRLPNGKSLYCGDVHMHTFFSDDTPSPVGITCEAFYSFMDFNVVSDHNTLEGALLAEEMMKKSTFRHPIIVGEEITTPWSHFNAYPLTALVDWTGSAEDIVRDVHKQNAVVQWNHPGYPAGSEWVNTHTQQGIGGTGLDAWEHYPPQYQSWKAAKRLPVIVGSTDTHDGTFSYAERTAILAASPNGNNVADAIRQRDAAMINISRPAVVYGDEAMIAVVKAALSQPDYLRKLKRARIRESLSGINIKALLTDPASSR